MVPLSLFPMLPKMCSWLIFSEHCLINMAVTAPYSHDTKHICRHSININKREGGPAAGHKLKCSHLIHPSSRGIIRFTPDTMLNSRHVYTEQRPKLLTSSSFSATPKYQRIEQNTARRQISTDDY